jgi:hypothetical protein
VTIPVVVGENILGVASSDILLGICARGDADFLASHESQHYHGLPIGSPFGRKQTEIRSCLPFDDISMFNKIRHEYTILPAVALYIV